VPLTLPLPLTLTLYQEEQPVLYGADYLKSYDGTISDKIQDIGLNYLYHMKRKGDELNIDECH
jgi:hypothetical protein